MFKRTMIFLVCALFVWTVGAVAADNTLPLKYEVVQANALAKIAPSPDGYNYFEVKLILTGIPREAAGMTIPIAFTPEDAVCTDISFVGSCVEGFTGKYPTLNGQGPNEHKLLLGLIRDLGPDIDKDLPTQGLIAAFTFKSKTPPQLSITTWQLNGGTEDLLFVDAKGNNILSTAKGSSESPPIPGGNGPSFPTANIPTSFALYPAYPNPFNPFTTISFMVPAGAIEWNLNIYNVVGQKVKSYNGNKTGQQTVFWDGTDDSGNQVASGIYFYKLVAGTHQATAKMTLLK